jgi:2-desacetyl-2-hydroxyethyl bacteriochlorophyllide A dehydrogenase
MRAVRCVEGEITIADLPSPSGEGVLVKVRSAGICGSDLHLVDSPYPLGFTLGHEIAGELADGTPVAIEPIVNCQTCDCCTRGAYNTCRQGAAIGIGLDGGMAEEVMVPERCLVRLAPALSVADACLVEPLAVAVHGIRRVGISASDRVAVIGGGTIGQCAVAAASAAGASVALEARHDVQRSAAEKLGAGEAKGEYDVVVDAAGTSSALEDAVKLCRPGGTLLLLGTYWEGMTMPGMPLCMKEIRVVPSLMYSKEGVVRDFDVATSLLENRPEIVDAIVTHRYSLDSATEAFQTARDRSAGAIKVVLEPS